MLPPTFKLAARTLVSASLVLCGLFAIERPFGVALGPFFRKEIEWLAPEFTIRFSYKVTDNSRQDLSFMANLSKAIHVGDHVLSPFPNPRADSQAAEEFHFPFSDVFKYCPLTLILVFAWPAASLREQVVRVALALPLMAILVVIDIPSAILANLYNDVRNELGVPGVSGWVLFRRCLSGGGGLVLASLMAAAAVAAGKWCTVGSSQVSSASKRNLGVHADADSLVGDSPEPPIYHIASSVILAPPLRRRETYTIALIEDALHESEQGSTPTSGREYHLGAIVSRPPE